MTLRPQNSASPHLIRPNSKTSFLFHKNQIRSSPIRSYFKENQDESFDKYRQQVHRIDDSKENDINKLQRQLTSKVNALNEREVDCQNLKTQCHSLEEWNNHLQNELAQKQQQQAQMKKKNDGYVTQVSAIKANYEIEIKELSSQVKQMNKNLSENRPDLQVKFLESEIQQLQDLMSMKTRENTVMSNNLKIMSEEIKKLLIKVETSKIRKPDSSEDLLMKLTQKNKEIETLIKEKTNLITELEDLSSKDNLKDLKKELYQQNAVNKQLLQQIEDIQHDIKRVQQDKAYSQSHHKDRLKIIESQQQEIMNQQMQLDSIKCHDSQVNKMEKELFEHKDQLKHTQSELRQSQSQLELMRGSCQSDQSNGVVVYELNQLKVQLAEKMRKADQQQEFIRKLQDLLEAKTLECDELFKQRQTSERKINSLSDDLQAHKSRINLIEREKIVDHEELQVKMHVNHQHMTQTIKSDYEQKILKMQDEIFDLKRTSSSTHLSGVFSSVTRSKQCKSIERLL